jgi:hypothetical protein
MVLRDYPSTSESILDPERTPFCVTTLPIVSCFTSTLESILDSEKNTDLRDFPSYRELLHFNFGINTRFRKNTDLRDSLSCSKLLQFGHCDIGNLAMKLYSNLLSPVAVNRYLMSSLRRDELQKFYFLTLRFEHCWDIIERFEVPNTSSFPDDVEYTSMVSSEQS